MQIFLLFLLSGIFAKDYNGPTMQTPCQCTNSYTSCIKSSGMQKPTLVSKDKSQLQKEAKCMKNCLSTTTMARVANCVYGDEAVNLQSAIEQCRRTKYAAIPTQNLGCKYNGYDSINDDIGYNSPPLGGTMSNQNVWNCVNRCQNHGSFNSVSVVNGQTVFSSSSASSNGMVQNGWNNRGKRQATWAHSQSFMPPNMGNVGFMPPNMGNTGFMPPNMGNVGFMPPPNMGNAGFMDYKIPYDDYSNAYGDVIQSGDVYINDDLVINGDSIVGPDTVVNADSVVAPDGVVNNAGFVGNSAITGSFDARKMINCARTNDCYPVQPKVAGCNAQIEKYNKKISSCTNGGHGK